MPRICFWLPLGACTYLALTPDPGLDAGGAPLNHILAFSYLTPALWLAHFDRSGWRPVILWMLAYGVGLELVQGMLPWRAAEIRDVGMDVAGILIGAALYHALRRAMQWLRGRAGRMATGGASVRRAASGGPRSES